MIFLWLLCFAFLLCACIGNITKGCKMNNMNFICPTCKRPTQLDNEMIEYLVNEKNKYRAILGERTKELERIRKALDVAVDGLEKMTWGCDSSDAEHLLKEIKEITALEQKDK